MAATYRFYKIGEANAEITRLEGELTSTAGRVKELETQVGGNESELSAQLTERDKQITSLQSEAKTSSEKLSTLEAEIKTLKAAQSDFDAKVEKAASAKALQITASQGAPIIPAKPGDVTVDPAKQKISELRGIDKVQACIAAELSAASTNKR